MNIPKEHIKLLRKSTEEVTQGLNSLLNLLILMEEDKLTEQCGVNTSNSFNTPPMDDYVVKPFVFDEEVIPAPGKTQTPDPKFTPKPPGELDPETWKCNEPREPNPVEIIIDMIMKRELPDKWQWRAEEAQAFLDDNARLLTPGMRELQEQVNKELAKRVEKLEKHIEGLEEIAKRYRPDLDVLDEFPKLHFKNVHVIRLLLWELGVGKENKTD